MKVAKNVLTTNHPPMKQVLLNFSCSFRKLLVLIVFLNIACTLFGQTAPPKHVAWNLTFVDEFDSVSLDTSKWSFGFGWDINSVAFHETNRLENVFLSEGNLVIRVDTIPGEEGWYSGAINSREHFSQFKGYFEARIKAAKGNGYINAFWSMPVTNDWPPEIDFVEVLGKIPTEEATFTVHWDDNGHKQSGREIDVDMDLSEDFHVYGCEWADDYFAWYLDGEEIRRTSDGYENITGFGEPFYMMLNVHVVAVGNPSWTGVPDETNQFPAYMNVDWVRVYQKDTSLRITTALPVMDETFSPGSNILFKADIENQDGATTKTTFYVNDFATAEICEKPYQYDWENVAAGRYKITSGVTDSLGREVISSPVFITVGDIASSLLLNHNFEEGVNHWELEVSELADADLVGVTGNETLEGDMSGLINIIEPGPGTPDIELKQGIYLKKDTKYELSFMGKATDNRRVITNVRVDDEKSNILAEVANFTTEKQSFSYIFTSSKDDYTAKTVWKIGGSSANVYIDSVVLKEYKPSGIRDYEVGLQLYPSLVKDIVNIRINDRHEQVVQVCFYNLSGKKIYSHEPLSSFPESSTIELSHLEKGFYLVKVKTKSNTYTGKILKE